MTDTAIAAAATRTSAPKPAGDNLFGVCAGVAEEFGFNPLWLRLAFAISFLASPELVAGTYFALGAVVLLGRLVAPRRKRTGTLAALMPTPVAPREREVEVDLPLAA